MRMVALRATSSRDPQITSRNRDLEERPRRLELGGD